MVILNLPLTPKSLGRNRIKLGDNRGCAAKRAIGTQFYISWIVIRRTQAW